MAQVAEPVSHVETLARVLVYFDSGENLYWAECIDCGGIASGSSVEVSLSELIPVVLDLADSASRHGIPLNHPSSAEDEDLFSRGPGSQDEIGRDLVATASILRNRKWRAVPKGREEFHLVTFEIHSGHQI
jgi:hypothetical protein